MSQPLNLPLQPDAVFHGMRPVEPVRPAAPAVGVRSGAAAEAGYWAGLGGWDRLELSAQGRVLAHAGRLYREGGEGWQELRDWVEVNGAFWEPLPTYRQYGRRQGAGDAPRTGTQAQEERSYWERLDAAEAAALRLRGRLELAPEEGGKREARGSAPRIVDLWV